MESTRFIFYVAVAVLSAALVSNLPLPKRYSTRQEQEEYFRKNGYYEVCLEILPPEDGNELYKKFEGDIIEPDQFHNETTEDGTDTVKLVDPDDEQFRRVVICFQIKFSLQQTGCVDEQTREMMELLEHDLENDYIVRKKRYVTLGAKWDKASVTYYVKNYDVNHNKSQMSDQLILSEIQAAIKMWAVVIGLTITELNSTSADILIGFYPDNHGDFPFKGANLAHTFRPGTSALSGDIHVRADVAFTAFTSNGINLRYVVLHEFGHALGLDHSDATGAVMAPERRDYDPKQQLSDDDIKGVQSLYGAPTDQPPSKPTSPPSSKLVSQPTSKPTSRPITKPTSQRENKPTNKPTSQPAKSRS